MNDVTDKKGRGGRRKGAGRKPGSTQPQIAAGWYVYALCEQPDAGFIKIGIANKPYSRLSAAQTSNPRRLVFAALWSLGGSDVYMACEKALHRSLRPFHVRGEWFEVAIQDIERHLGEITDAFGVEAKRVM